MSCFCVYTSLAANQVSTRIATVVFTDDEALTTNRTQAERTFNIYYWNKDTYVSGQTQVSDKSLCVNEH